jgi:hypothetical protein
MPDFSTGREGNMADILEDGIAGIAKELGRVRPLSVSDLPLRSAGSRADDLSGLTADYSRRVLAVLAEIEGSLKRELDFHRETDAKLRALIGDLAK